MMRMSLVTFKECRIDGQRRGFWWVKVLHFMDKFIIKFNLKGNLLTTLTGDVLRSRHEKERYDWCQKGTKTSVCYKWPSEEFPRDSFPFGHFFCLVTDREIILYSGTVDHMRSINYIATTVNRVEEKSSSGNTGWRRIIMFSGDSDGFQMDFPWPFVIFHLAHLLL